MLLSTVWVKVDVYVLTKNLKLFSYYLLFYKNYFKVCTENVFKHHIYLIKMESKYYIFSNTFQIHFYSDISKIVFKI